ncbi:hypothetical protein ACOME3_005242, partial [Neoechinorhynchus agilis]
MLDPSLPMPPPPPTTSMPSPRLAPNLDARQKYEDGNLLAQNEPSEKTEETPNATGTPGRNSAHQVTDADALNEPLIDHAELEKINAAGLPRVSTGLCPVCGKSFQLTNLGVLFVHGPRRYCGSGSPPHSTDLFMAGISQITIDSISIPDIVRVLPRNVLKRIPRGARYQVAKAFTGLLNDCFVLRLVLCTSDDSGVSLTSTIKEKVTFAQGDSETLQILRSKHPCSSPSPPIQDRTPTQISEIKKAISTFANGSGHGFDGLRPQHLKDMMSFSTGEAALSRKCAFSNSRPPDWRGPELRCKGPIFRSLIVCPHKKE